jgi:DNA-binding transcriptional LysR family regulator
MPIDYRRLVTRLKLRHLELLQALGEDPNVHRAAARLNMSQPTASKLLREIELAVGQALFTRHRRGLEPTPVGRVMTRRSGLALSEIGAAHAEMNAVAAGATGRLRLGVFPVAVPWLMPALGAVLHERQPGLVLKVQAGLEDTLLPALEAGELDCVLGRIVPEMLTADLVHEVLYLEPTVVVCGSAHPILRARGRRRLELLSSSGWVLPSRRGALHTMVASRLAQASLPGPRVIYEATSVFTVIELLSGSTLLSALSQHVARSAAANGRLAVLPIDLPAASYPVGVMVRRDRFGSAAVQEVFAALRAIVLRRLGDATQGAPAQAGAESLAIP